MDLGKDQNLGTEKVEMMESLKAPLMVCEMVQMLGYSKEKLLASMMVQLMVQLMEVVMDYQRG